MRTCADPVAPADSPTKMDLGRAGFVIENEWYWRITEGATTLDATAAMRDFLAPLARIVTAIHELVAEHETRRVTFRLGGQAYAIALARAADRVAVNGLVGDINRAFASAELGLAFALVVPNRFELRGVVLPEAALGSLAGDPVVLVPSTRPSWRATPSRSP